MAKLYFRYGAMNSGKSTALLQVAHNYEERGMKVLLLKRDFDSKGESFVVSRLNVKREVDLIIKENDNIINKIKDYDNISCILVDEAQFFTKDHIDQMYEIAVVKNIPVICYGLRTDFRTEGFLGSERLLLIAHSLEELKTICTCGKKAMHNTRKVNGKWVFVGDQVAIDDGAHIEYVSLCPSCYFEKRKEMEGV
ncbi:MAG: thymidine kinase [Bacilli bacterium]